jgi:oligoendopeptidase F
MEHKKDIPLRSELRLEDTWNLVPIYADDAAWEADFVEVDGKAPKAADYQGRLGESAQVLLDAIKFQEEVYFKVGLLYVYAHLNFDTDTTNAHYQAMFSRIESLYAKTSAAFSFYRSELMEIDEEKIWRFVDQKEELKIYKHEFEQMFAKRAYILSDKEERILAEGTEIFSAPSTIFGMLNNADLKLPLVKGEDGEESQLSHGRYVLFLESRVRDVRRGAFMGMYHTYRDLKNTFATTLGSMIKAHNFNARIRGYSSARHAALFANAIPESVYDSLVEAVNSRLDLMHRYVDLRKNVLKLDDIAMYDLYTPLVEEIDVKFTYSEAQSLILEGLSVLGEEYQAILKEAFQSRWIDVFENKGKRSGAYSSGTYGTSPYILMNWQDNIDNVFTLAHELGHSVHSYLTRKYQPFVYGDYSIFLAEVASTTNEILLTDFMLKKFDDPKIKAYLINHYLDGFKGTVFRQTQFAQFEHLIHDAQQNGTALTADFLTKNYFELNKKYYGEQMTYNEEIGFEWARIPHFYYNYYVYQYATGFSAASALSAKILNEGPMAIEAYLNYLKSGSSDVPIEVLKKAGVDMTSNQATKDALVVFEDRLKQLEEILLK